jgi:hypothetical protein
MRHTLHVHEASHTYLVCRCKEPLVSIRCRAREILQELYMMCGIVRNDGLCLFCKVMPYDYEWYLHSQTLDLSSALALHEFVLLGASHS